MQALHESSGLIVEFGACLNDWKQAKRAPLLERKLSLRKEPGVDIA